MKVVVHLPRQSEARVDPLLKQDVTITPIFYRKTGQVPVAYVTTEDAKNRKEQYVLYLNAATKQLKIEKLVEVIPACDEEKPDADDGGPAHNPAP